MNDELLARTRCILKHLDDAERDGLANSFNYIQQAREDARAIEDLVIDGRTDKPVHL
jgi:hypothetical protein